MCTGDGGAIAAQQATLNAEAQGWTRRSVGTISEGDVFAEKGLLAYGSPGNYSLVATTDACVVWLEAADYADVLHELGNDPMESATLQVLQETAPSPPHSRGSTWVSASSVHVDARGASDPSPPLRVPSVRQTAILESHYESRLAIRTFLAARAKMFSMASNVGQCLGPSADSLGIVIDAIASRIEMHTPAEEEALITAVGPVADRGGRVVRWSCIGGELSRSFGCMITARTDAQGESAAGLFIVIKGHCNCYIDAPDERDGLKLVKVVHVGDHFGELSLLEPGSGARAHVRAGPLTRVALLSPSAFEQARGNSVAIAWQ